MSKFFVEVSDSEEEEEEEFLSDQESLSPENDAIFKPLFEKIENELNNLLSSINSNEDKKSLISQLANSFNEYNAACKNTKVKLPNKILDQIINIKQELFSKSKEENFSQLLTQYNQMICSKFTDEINNYCQKKNSKKSKQGGGWFVSSDDDEAEKIKTKVRNESRKPKTYNFFTGQITYENEEEEVIDDSKAKREIDRHIQSRQDGKISATTKRLNELLRATTDQKLMNLINSEIIYTIASSPVDKAIDNNDWTYALDAISTFPCLPNNLYPLLERLNKDYWARTIDLRYLFIPSTAQLHEIFPRYLELLNEFMSNIKIEEFPEVYIRTADILIEHIYIDENEQENLIRFAYSILDILSKINLEDPEFTTARFGYTPLSYDAENIRNRASLFLCYNFASTNHIFEAYSLFRRVQNINNNFRFTRVLCNRVRAQIGISAFKLRQYKISYEMLRQFIVIKSIAKNVGQEPKPIFPAWSLIDPQKVAYMNLFSSVFLDLPALSISTFSADENENSNIPLSVHPKMHRDLLKDPIAHPETPIEKAVAIAAFTKSGEWKKAFDIAKENLDEQFHADFLSDLKSLAICCFLMNAKDFYESLTFDFLAQMFEVDESEVKRVVNKMMDQQSPVEDIPIVFKKPKIVDDKYLLFE